MDGYCRRTVWIDNVDKEYRDRLISFLDFHYGNFLEVKPYNADLSPEETAKDILLTDAEIPGSLFAGKQIFFTESEGEEGINIFQSGHVIAKSLISLPAPEEDGMVSEEPAPLSICRNEFAAEKEGKVLCVFSPAGGVGTSTFARALAQMLQEECQGSILYLSMETASDWHVFYKNESSNNLSDLLYCLLDEENGNFDDELQQVAKRQMNGVYFVKPCTSYKDLRALTLAEWKLFFARLEKRFSYVVLDMGCVLSESSELIFSLADRIYLLQRDAATDEAKSEAFQAEINADPVLRQCFGKKAVSLVRKVNPGRDKSLFVLPDDREIFVRKEDRMVLKEDGKYLKKVRDIVKKEAGIMA